MEKHLKFGELKGINAEEKSITALVSTYEWDRYDEKFSKGAWDLKNFLDNPVVLWSHNKSLPPIARAVSITETDKGLESKMVFDMENDFAKNIFRLYKEKFLKAFSVGFWPDWNSAKFEPMEGSNKQGLVWGKAELLEYSAVAVPANPGALVGKDLCDDIIRVYGDCSVIEKEGGFEVTPMKIPGLTMGKLAPQELTQALKYMIDISKITKKDQLDSQKISLIETSIDLIKENLLGDYKQNGISRSELLELKGVVEQAGKLLVDRYPDVNDLVSKFMLQLTKAVKGQ